MMRPEIFVGSALFLLGCDDPLKPAQRLDEPRLLGVRVSTEQGDASLVPGAPARLELLLAGRDGPEQGRAGYRLCVAASSQRGVPYCAEPPWVEGQAELGDGAIAFDVPSSLGPGLRIVVLGVVCTRGLPALADTPLDYGCSGGGSPLRFSFDARTLQGAAHPNPDLSELVVTLAGEQLAPSAADHAPRCDGATQAVAAGESYPLAIELGAAALSAKELQLSHISTRGDLERQFSFVSLDSPRAALSWAAPLEPGPAKQYLIVRDGGGGVTFASWDVCVE